MVAASGRRGTDSVGGARLARGVAATAASEQLHAAPLAGRRAGEEVELHDASGVGVCVQLCSGGEEVAGVL